MARLTRRTTRLLIAATALVALVSASTAHALVKEDDGPSSAGDAAAEMLEIATRAAEEAKPVEPNSAAKAKLPADEEEPGLVPLIRRFTPQIRPLARAEVHFILSACSPTQEQRAMLVREGERVLKEAVREHASAQNKMQNGAWIVSSKQPDPREAIVEGMAAVLKANLTPEQFAAYRKEADARAAHRKVAALHNLVAIMDIDLALDADQRAEIGEALAENWDDNWSRSFQMFIYGPGYFPKLPDRAVVPFLTPMQKVAWARKPTNDNVSWSGLGFWGRFSLDDEPMAEAVSGDPEPSGPISERH